MPDLVPLTFDPCRVVDADKGRVEDLGPDGAPRRKVAIVGFAGSSRHLAPFTDPTWSVWGMNQLYRFVPRLTRWFEIHPHTGPRSYLADQAPGTDYLGWMKACPVPLYMVSRREDIPTSIAYPIERFVDQFRLNELRADGNGKGYFHSSVDYMLALALAEGFEEIGVWGIDMSHDTEYERQKPSASFWLGVAHGRGVKLTIPNASALLNNMGYRYGWDPDEQKDGAEDLAQAASRQRAIQERMGQLQTEMHQLTGILQDLNHWTEYFKHRSRGAVVLPATSTI